MLLSPWSEPRDPEVTFPIEPFERLLFELGWNQPSVWLEKWAQFGGTELAYSFWPSGINTSWIWGIGLPLLSDIERCLAISDKPVLFGVTGLPGCGKTSLGRWLEAAAVELNLSLSVISMDDFYLPSNAMEKAMAGNPWNVPRALPGSHSIELIKESIDSWLETGTLRAPRFDKSLRNGLGDRCGWLNCQPKVLVIEGWFLGCSAKSHSKEDIGDFADLLLNKEESIYIELVKRSLESYESIWDRFHRIWHLKASDFTSTSLWKKQQEMNMRVNRGASLEGELLDSFIRMVQVAIPQEILQSIEANVVAKINASRGVDWIGINEK